MNIIIGLVLIVIGVLIMKYRYQIYHTTGDWSWADQWVGSTVSAIALIGALFLFVGVTYPFGVWETQDRVVVEGGDRTETR